jgi:excinuclease ABC subunit B
VSEGEGRFNLRERIQDLEKRMLEAAEALDFEQAAELRDRIVELKKG